MTATTLEKPQQEAAPLYINRAALEFPETQDKTAQTVYVVCCLFQP